MNGCAGQVTRGWISGPVLFPKDPKLGLSDFLESKNPLLIQKSGWGTLSFVLQCWQLNCYYQHQILSEHQQYRNDNEAQCCEHGPEVLI